MILVTGATGFVGQHLCRRLRAQGSRVRALYFRTPPPASLPAGPDFEWVQGDLLDLLAVEDMLEGIKQVYHLAGTVSFHPQDRKRLLDGNVLATENLINECIEREIDKLVFLGSVSALGRKGAGEQGVNETVAWEESGHYSFYGKTKHLAEMEVWRGIAEGLKAVILNPATILGEGDWEQGSCRLVKLVYEEFPFYTDGVTGWVDVEDVVEAAILAMNSPVNAERFILSEGNYAFRYIFQSLAQYMGRRPPRWKAGALGSALVWRWNALKRRLGAKHTSLSRETATMAQRKVYYDNSKFLKFFPDFHYQSMDATLKRLAKAYLKDIHEKAAR